MALAPTGSGEPVTLVILAMHSIVGICRASATYMESSSAADFQTYFHLLAQAFEITRWSRDLCRAFPRRSSANVIANVMPSELNPLTTIVGFRPSQIRWCSMHVLNLGVVQVVNGSAVQLLLEEGQMYFEN